MIYAYFLSKLKCDDIAPPLNRSLHNPVGCLLSARPGEPAALHLQAALYSAEKKQRTRFQGWEGGSQIAAFFSFLEWSSGAFSA
jgi:hypothetical protein